MEHTRITAFDLIALSSLLLFCFILLFWEHAILPMQAWDESRIANNALEMARNGNWLIPSYGGLPDHWNTKPPLLIWAVAALMRAGTPPLLALRIPSFLAVTATIAASWSFCVFVLRDRVAGAISGVLLITSGLYAGPHVALTGDYDALLTFFILVYSLTFWLSIDGTVLQLRWLTVAASALSLAILTKGIAALLPLPALLAFSVMRGKVSMVLLTWQAWVLVGAVISLGIGYYYFRELYDPGYILAVINNEVGGRFSGQHNSYRSYYVVRILERDIVLVVLALLMPFAFFDGNFRIRSFAVLCSLFTGSLLIILTLSYNKHYWYLAPAYPLLTMAVALGISSALRRLGRFFFHNGIISDYSVSRILILGLLVCSIVAFFLSKDVAIKLEFVKGFPHYDFSHLFSNIRDKETGGPIFLIVNEIGEGDGSENYNPIAKFYVEVFRHSGPKFIVISPNKDLPTGSKVATCDRELESTVEAHPGFRTLWRSGGCLFGEIASIGWKKPR